ncbi:Uncharacterised protein [Suttonella ornithocola]|uniref:Uncharacterized protein n=2 Tax=Suttonella ornithocola TaxID=279832 RepID=A0A380MXV6_9GAMM|nr:Uncharacterised protein [Suttonella ornithocola]
MRRIRFAIRAAYLFLGKKWWQLNDAQRKLISDSLQKFSIGCLIPVVMAVVNNELHKGHAILGGCAIVALGLSIASLAEEKEEE